METLATYAASPPGTDALGPEAITCRDYVVPRLLAAGWSDGRRSIAEQQDYAEILGLKFAYATNGHGIVEHDYFTGLESHLDGFPTPGDLWQRYRAGQGLADDALAQRV